MDSRPKLLDVNTGKFYPISTYVDFKETLNLMQVAASGVRPYLVDWFNNRFLSVYNDLGGKPDKIYNDDIGKYVTVSKEKRAGLTTKQIADRIGEKFGGLKLSTKECYEKEPNTSN